MRWTAGDRSNIDDERARPGLGVGGGVSIGLGGLVLLLVLSWATGTDFFSLIGSPGAPPSGAVGTSGRVVSSPAEEQEVDFVDAVMKDVQQTWRDLLPGQYQPTKAVLFRDAIDSACGLAQSATGPFYCPADERVYLDLGFFDELRDRFGAPGDFARAYVLAHEVGHHVQRLTGIEGQVRALQREEPNATNALSVRLELQADCFAGVWGRTARATLQITDEDLGEALNAAHAIGDDTLGHSDERTFTHGSSEQRKRWFRRGFESGDARQCDTFGVQNYREL